MTISVILTKFGLIFLQFSRENLKNREIFLPFCFFPTDRKYDKIYIESKAGCGLLTTE